MESTKRSLSSDEDGPGPSSKVLKVMQPGQQANMQSEMNDPLFDKVIGNDVIFDNLERMLAYKDLKSLRLVRKTGNEVVLKHKFIRKTKFNVYEGTIDSKVLDNLSFKPKHLKIEQFVGVSLEDSAAKKPLPNDFSMQKLNELLGYRIRFDKAPIWSIDEMKPVLKLCEDIDTMEIIGRPYHLGTDECCVRAFPPAKDLLAAAKSLKSLTISCLGDEEYDEVEGGQTGEPTIAVKSLTLQGQCGSIIRCVKGFENLTRINVSMPRYQHLDSDNDSYMRTIMATITSHSSTLQWIDLDSDADAIDQDIFTTLNMTDRAFPKLEYFKTSFVERETHSVLHFISSHFSQLKELSLQLKGKTASKFPLPLLRFLGNSKASKLLALRLYHPYARFYFLREEDQGNEPSTSLNLRHLCTFQEFEMDFAKLVSVVIGIQDLPSSLQKISISPCRQILTGILPVVLKIVPELIHLELYYNYGGGIIFTETDLKKLRQGVGQQENL